MQKLTKAQFCNLANRREEVKRKRKAAQEWQAKQDIDGVSTMRLDRIYKKSRIVI
jgi:hypothetical protein